MKSPINHIGFKYCLQTTYLLLFLRSICQSQPELKWPIDKGTYHDKYEFTSDGKKILTSVSNCSTKRIWDIDNGRLVILDAGWIEIQPFGEIALTGYDDSVRIWDITTGKVKHILKGYYGLFSPDGNLILTCSINPDSTWIWDSHTGELLYAKEGAYFKFSPDGKWIINRSENFRQPKTVNIFESITGRLFRCHKEKSLVNYSISKGNRYLLIGKYNKTNVYDFTTDKRITSLEHRQGKYRLPDERVFSPDGKWFVLSRILYKEDGIWKGKTKITQISTGKFIKKITWSCCKCQGIEIPIPSRIVFSQDGKYFYMHIDCSSAGIFESSTCNLIHTLNIDEYRNGTEFEIIEFSHNGKWLATSIFYENSTKIWDVKTGDLIWNIRGTFCDFNKNYPLILVDEDNEICTIVSLTNGEPLISFEYIGLNDWVVTHPSGLFDASPGAMEKLYFVQDDEIIELDSLKDKYYEPGLWEKVMSGKPLRILEE